MRAYFTVVVALILALTGCSSVGTGNKSPAKSLLEKYNWAVVGDVRQGSIELPSDFTLQAGRAPWRVWLDLSISVGLDFSSQAGNTVKILHYKVRDQKGRLPDNDLQAVVLIGADDEVIGAWMAPIQGAEMGYSVEGKDLEHVTGLSWAEYLEKNSAKH